MKIKPDDFGIWLVSQSMFVTAYPHLAAQVSKSWLQYSLELEDDMHASTMNRLPEHLVHHEIAPRPDGFFRQWVAAMMRQWRRRKMIAALSAMDDRLLRDIGIYRQDIVNVVDGLDERELRMVPVAPSLLALRSGHNTRQQAA